LSEVLSILQDPSAMAYLATVDEGKPRVRPWGTGYLVEETGKIYFSTSSTKAVYRQLLETPYVEYSKTTASNAWIRISGEIHFDEDSRVKEQFFLHEPGLARIYQSPDNPVFKLFYLEQAIATVDDYTPNPQRVYSFAKGVFTLQA
jgi:uncharacterized pyridoxamine 5'-phosphate oxidase family protein